MNVRVGNEEAENLIRKYGVSGRNESGGGLLETCMDHVLVLRNNYFKR